MMNPRSSHIVDTTHSPHAALRAVPVSAVSLTDHFWSPRLRVNRSVTLASQHARLEESAVLDNFRRVSGRKAVPSHVGRPFNDTDAYKWLEAVAWTLASARDAALEAQAASVIDDIAAAQHADGYLNTLFSLERASDRWTNLRDRHELYNAGHLFQAAVAMARCLPGAAMSDQFLTVATRFADLLCDTFGPASAGKRELVDGHQIVESGLIELFRLTQTRRYLDLAKFFIHLRGHKTIAGDAYHQDHIPLRDAAEVTGHAVRQVYFTMGGADLLLEESDDALRAALHRLWKNLTTRRMYITGGVGSRYDGEAIGNDFELPNDRAYTETCAAIGNLQWNWRMLLLEADIKFADLVELCLYNGILSGISLSGTEYFYQNPLANDGTHRRTPWFTVACCPPNLARTLAQLTGYFYTTSHSAIWAHLFASSLAHIALGDRTITLEQQTDYPWSGRVRFIVHSAATFTLHIRIPGWCRDRATFTLNAAPVEPTLLNGYAQLHRAYSPGDIVEVDLPMHPTRLVAHPSVPGNTARTCLTRGPLVYCIEQADHATIDLDTLTLPDAAPITARHHPDLLTGITTLHAQAHTATLAPAWQHTLYSPTLATEPIAITPTNLTAIPYYAWSNRTPGPMRVWIKKHA
jgi:uncharacterized protein